MGEYPFRPELSSVEIALFRKLLDKHDLSDHEQLIAPWLQRCIGIHKDGDDDYSEVGNSRLAGLPDLPPGWGWPTRTYELDDAPVMLSFAGQFNLAELAPYQTQLPPKGILYVFLDADPYESQSKVLYYDGPLEALRRYPLTRRQVKLRMFDTDMATVDELPLWYPRRVRFEGGLSIPSYKFRLYKDKFYDDFELGDRYLEVQGDLRGDFEHSLFLHPFYQGADPCDLGDDEPTGAPKGTTLFCFESDEDLGFSFGSYGCKQIVIPRDRLIMGDFSWVYTTEQGN